MNIEYPTLTIDPKFLDPKKLGGVMEQLLQWLGPVGLLFKTTQGRALDDLIPVLNAEMEYHRAFVKDLLEEIFNEPSFISPGDDEDVPGKADGVAAPRITVEFNSLTLVTFKNLLAYATLILTNGIGSPQTTRRILNLNEEEENAFMKSGVGEKATLHASFRGKAGPSSTAGAGCAGAFREWRRQASSEPELADDRHLNHGYFDVLSNPTASGCAFHGGEHRSDSLCAESGV